MALNTAEQLRFFINDRPRLSQETFYGDGTGSAFQVSGYPIITGATALGGFAPSAYNTASGGASWTATGATFNYNLGQVSFSAVPSANSALMVRYTYATFSDAEIDLVTGLYSDLPTMRLALIDNLMGDAYKRARWGAGAGGAYDDSKTLDNLMSMRSAVRAEMTTEQGPQMVYGSWDVNQEEN